MPPAKTVVLSAEKPNLLTLKWDKMFLELLLAVLVLVLHRQGFCNNSLLQFRHIKWVRLIDRLQ